MVNPNFPENCWDLLLPHTEDTLNMLRPSKTNPLVSAYTILRGHFNFMKTPIAPAGCTVLVHDRPTSRGSWADRGTEGYFISQAPDHYRNFTCYMPNTNSIRITNTIEFFPQNCSLPILKPLDTVAHILSDLKTTLNYFPRNNLVAGPHHELLQALNDVQGLLGLSSHQENKTPALNTQQKDCNTYKGGLQGPVTRSQTKKIHQNGTIIRKRFNKTWYKGEVTKYDPQADFYTIKYTDGDTEEMTYGEVKQYKNLFSNIVHTIASYINSSQQSGHTSVECYKQDASGMNH